MRVGSRRVLLLAAFANYLFLDNFTGEDNGPLAGRALEIGGNGWTVDRGTWQIFMNSAEVVTLDGAGRGMISTDARRANLRVRCTFTGGAGAAVARSTDGNNLWQAYHTGTDLIIKDVQAGVITERANFASEIAADGWVEIECRDTTITARDSAGGSVSFTSSFNQEATRAGCWAENSSHPVDKVEGYR